MGSHTPKRARRDAFRSGLHLTPGEQANLTKLNDVYVSHEAGSRWKLAPQHVDFALRVVPLQHEMPSSLKDAFRIARAMASVVVGYAPNPALPGFPALFGRPKEVYDLVVAGVDVGLDRGRHPGLPLAIAKVTRPST
jgi:hypothetical protein